MLTDFASLLLSRQELKELHEALVMRAMVEDDLRSEEGLESVDRRPLIERTGQLLAMNEQRLQAIEDHLDQELWRHSWYTYTDEWAWYRARRDVLNEVGSVANVTMESKAVDDLIHRRYHERFEDYIQEIDMNPCDSAERTSRQKKMHRK
jgi:hypothetical protein